jgi:soluble lytic murein transglycosylase
MRRRSFLPLPGLLLAAPAIGQTIGLPSGQPQVQPVAMPRPLATPDARAAGRTALAMAQAGRWPEAEAAAAGADPLIAKMVTWLRLQSRDGGGTAPETVGFLLANPEWPAQDLLARRAEEQLEAYPDNEVALRFFEVRAPRGLDGFQRLADAVRQAGRASDADKVLAHGWTVTPADPEAEPGYLDRNAALLTTTVHWQRFDRLNLPRDTASAGRLLPLLPPERQAAATARVTFAANAPEAEGLTASPMDAGLAAHRARWLRRRDRDAEAAEAFKAGEAAQKDMCPPVAKLVWEERQILARKLLRQGDAATAYAVAANHGQVAPGEAHQDAEFLAGFIALRRLEQPAKAVAHFEKVAARSHSIITRARGAYWQGRAAAARGDAAKALEHYRAAAELPVAFYGQLAALALGENGATLSARINQVPAPTATTAEAQALEQSELARLCLVLADLGETRRARTFLLRLEELAHSPGAKALVARLAYRIGRPDHAVWVTRRAGISGAMMLAEGWPTPYPAPPEATDPALVFAISRQESNFDPEAVSSSNARGVMQLLPTTAMAVARRLSIRHQMPMLTADPQHNIRLGAAYLDEMLQRFDGAVPLAVAAYNAGPMRVTEWLGAFGDPRVGFVTMLDWMEMIPFAETRNYVQRVQENIAIYHAKNPATQGLEHPMTPWLAKGA